MLADAADRLIGRERERAAVAGVLAAATTGRSGVLVVRGEPGIGKTLLVERTVAEADMARVLRTGGVEAEADLDFAGLHRLLRPVADRVDDLNAPQAHALAAALGLGPSRNADRFLVGVAALGLLAAVAEDGPLVCVVDDAHLLDDATTDALVFCARRLAAEPIAMLFVARTGAEREFTADGLPELTVTGLDEDSAAELLPDVGAAAVRTWLLAAAAGNPLALVELPSGLSEAQLRGEAALPDAAPLTARLQSAFAARTQRLSESTQDALLIAALDDGDDAATTLAAAAHAGLGASALDAAEVAGLVTVTDGRLTFRHPLVRSAVRQDATLSRRRAAHAALAAVARDDDRRVWHAALAALSTDARASADLAAAARRAEARGGHASAATAFARAAELCPEDADRPALLAAAAQAAWTAGQPGRARALIADAIPRADGAVHADLLRLRGVIEARTGDCRLAVGLLLQAADATGEPSTKLLLLIEAADTALYVTDFAQIAAIGERVPELTEGADPIDEFRATALRGLAASARGDTAGGVEQLAAAARHAAALDDPRALMIAARVATLIGTHGDGLDHAARAVALARERGQLSILPVALQEHATALLGRGRYALAYATAREGVQLARDFGQRWGASWNLVTMAALDALRGNEALTREHADAALELATATGASFVAGFAHRALALLDLTLGRTDAATDRFLAITEPWGPEANPILAPMSIPDLVESAARAGRLDEVVDRLAFFEAWVAASPVPARHSMLARCRAVAGVGDVAAEFETALEHATALSPFQQAHTELLYGEWLRRAREPQTARPHLRRAADAFRSIGVAPWEQRAEAELRATGETIRRRDPSTIDELTPQELQIAGLVAAGLTNREVAGQLYLSPRTIDYHLRKVFSKLAVTSRTELARIDLPQ